MGGLNEAVIQAEKATTETNRATGAAVTLQELPGYQAIRRHEDPKSQQVHFHVDAQQLKVGIPTSRWASWWQQLLEQGPGKLHYYLDSANGTVLEVELRGTSQADGSLTVEAFFQIRRLTMGPTLASMHEFSKI